MRWFLVTATKMINSETMQYDAVVNISVLARDKNEAMRKVRPEFRHWFLEVA